MARCVSSPRKKPWSTAHKWGDMLKKEYNGKPVKYPGLVKPDRVAVQALRDSAKGRDMSVCSFFVKYEHFLSKILPQKAIMKMWLSGIKDYV